METVTFYTPDYKPYAERLMKSCERHRVTLTAISLPDLGSWVANTCRKAWFIQDIYETLDEDILWLDADAEVMGPVTGDLWRAAGADVAYYSEPNKRHDRLKIRSGTLWIGRTPGAKRLLDEWAARCRSDPTRWDQEHLYHAVETTKPKLFPLSMPFCQRFDEPGHNPEDAVILHYQASRKQRRRRR